ncbi:hypothetical protein GCM10023149_50340 [Mucilaginibacter gynuensis]|uniref:Cytochrome c domain-containing protein n=1 Tax=Mucilaginibacter gynuensis TaxID=1302236 RepID=A0ABP8HHX8_9SPHI
MKKTFVILGLCFLLAACGGSTETGSNSNDTTAVDHTEVDDADTPATDTDTVLAKPEEKPEAAEKPEAPEKKEKPEKAEKSVGSAKGADLVSKSDCLTCHKLDVKIVGPAYADVAKKYKLTAENIDMLAKKVIDGGKGNWGEIPMSPHPNVSTADAKEMVKYILSIK